MRLAPLTLSVCENGAPGGAARSSCPFCGVRLAEGREPFLCADGSEESSCVEALGAGAHWAAERTVGVPIPTPIFDQAIAAIRAKAG